MTFSDETDIEPIVVRQLARARWGFPCPGCFGFTFERTSKDAAIRWAREHNETKHANRYPVEVP